MARGLEGQLDVIKGLQIVEDQTIEVTRAHEVTWIPDSVIDDTTLGKNEVLAYVALARHANRAGECFPSIRRIAKLSRLSTRTVQGALNELEGAGYVERHKQYNVKAPREHDVTRYVLKDKRSGKD